MHVQVVMIGCNIVYAQIRTLAGCQEVRKLFDIAPEDKTLQALLDAKTDYAEENGARYE